MHEVGRKQRAHVLGQASTTDGVQHSPSQATGIGVAGLARATAQSEVGLAARRSVMPAASPATPSDLPAAEVAAKLASAIKAECSRVRPSRQSENIGALALVDRVIHVELIQPANAAEVEAYITSKLTALGLAEAPIQIDQPSPVASAIALLSKRGGLSKGFEPAQDIAQLIATDDGIGVKLTAKPRFSAEEVVEHVRKKLAATHPDVKVFSADTPADRGAAPLAKPEREMQAIAEQSPAERAAQRLSRKGGLRKAIDLPMDHIASYTAEGHVLVLTPAVNRGRYTDAELIEDTKQRLESAGIADVTVKVRALTRWELRERRV